jgi:pyruvate-formate lyase-activating enzyme
MSEKIRPHLVFADDEGNIYDHPHLLMLVRRGKEWGLPRPDELIELPPESSLYLLPQRRALGLDPDSGQVEVLEENAVAAFVSPGYTLSGVCAFLEENPQKPLPLFAYGAVGFYQDKFYVAAKKVDKDQRQVFLNIPKEKIAQGARQLLQLLPQNRLIQHLTRCALTYSCPAAKNLALGRFEAPLPTAQRCNARCIGCISLQPEDSGFPATQKRISFRPKPQEIAEVMEIHAKRAKNPIFSFGQGCEGDPLTEWKIITKAITLYRKKKGHGTININTNGSIPEAVEPLARAGLTSFRISLNSAQEQYYLSYYRPNYSFAQVLETIKEAKKHNLFVSLNYLFFPGFNDTEQETEALLDLLKTYQVDFIQLRNLNLDPNLYLSLFPQFNSPSLGLHNFLKRIKKECPWIKFGYFNPYLGN